MKLSPDTPLSERLPVEADRTTVYVPVGDIRYVEARGHVVSVAVLDGFLRAHRAYLVNAHHVVSVAPLHSGLYVLHVDDRTRSQIPVSRHYASEVRRSLAS